MRGEALATDERFMRAALALGRRSMGRAAPNPAVGALVVQDGIVVGCGVTAHGGRPHAEPVALAQAGPAARGGTLYVTLEPCSHVGRTPPCVEAVLAAGVARVVVGMLDPDPRVAGQGIEQLRRAGIIVDAPVLETEAKRDHRGHCLRVTRGRPLVTVKMAETADGFAANPAGGPRLLITGSRANAEVHRLRLMHDAVMVGRGTVAEDDPLLTVRLPGVDRPDLVRIVLDSQLRIDSGARLFAGMPPPSSIIVAGEDASVAAIGRVEETGARVLIAPTLNGRLDLGAVLQGLGCRGLTRVLCEGGPTLASALITADLADDVVLLTAPTTLGGNGRAALSDMARSRIADPEVFVLAEERALGLDRLRRFTRRESSCSPA